MTENSAFNFDVLTASLSEAATEAVKQIHATVEKARQATDEVMDVVTPVVGILRKLSKGDRAGAVQAAMVMFSNDVSKEVAEARAACLATLAEAEASMDELDDILTMLAKQAAEMVDELQSLDLYKTLTGLFA